MRYFAWFILNLLNPVCILHYSISQFRLATFQRLNHQWSVVTVVHSAVLDIFWFYINRFNTLFCILLFSIITKISVSANEDMTRFLTAAFWMLSFFYYHYPLKFIISWMCEYTDLCEFLDLRVYTFKNLDFWCQTTFQKWKVYVPPFILILFNLGQLDNLKIWCFVFPWCPMKWASL